MNTYPHALLKLGTVALFSVCAGCATWDSMDRTEKGTAAGATGGALVGAAVGGPVGALVGAGAGGYAGHYETQPGGLATKSSPLRSNDASNARVQERAPEMALSSVSDADVVARAQRALNDRGFDPGAIDGMWGPNTEQAILGFQRANGLTPTGMLDDRTLTALDVNR